jgi:T5SS/PEP-CTERM-associated repeat protein
VGEYGNGTLRVEAAGELYTTSGMIASKSAGTGAATVTGVGSKWSNLDNLHVGDYGDGTLNVEAGGEVSSTSSYIGYNGPSTGMATITGAGSKWTNSAELYVGRTGDATLNVVAGGVVSNAFSYIGYKGSSTGIATVTGGGSKWTNSGSMTIGGSDTAAGGKGTLKMDDSGLVSVLGTTKLWDEGTINLDGGTLDTGALDLELGTFNMLDGLLRTDSVNGDITIQGGIFAPGHSPAVVSITGDYTQGAAATLEIELAGTGGGEFDLLMIGGTGNLDGTLNLVPLAPYTDPATRGTADDFVIIAAIAGSGAFNTVQYNGSALATDFGPDGNGSFRSHVGGGLFRNVTYTVTTAQQCSAWCNLVQLQNLLALPGDTDGDMDIDLSDYNTLTTNFDPLGTYGPYLWQDGNFDEDGDIDLSDYNSLASNFQPLGYGAAAVPEPAAVILALLALLLNLSGRLPKNSCRIHV